MANYNSLNYGIKDLSKFTGSYAAASTAVVQYLSHNQELLQNTFVPRQIINDFYQPLSGNVENFFTVSGSATMVCVWAGFEAIPETELVWKLNGNFHSGAPSGEQIDYHIITTPYLPSTETNNFYSLTGSSNHASCSFTGSANTWQTGSVQIWNGVGNKYYVSLWAQTSPSGSEASSSLINVSMRERMKELNN